MPPELEEADRIRLMHMRDAAQQALDFSRGRAREALDRDAMFRRALVNCIHEIGEAASRLSADAKQHLPDIPFPEIIAMRNRIVHAYFDIESGLVWEVVQKDLPAMMAALERVLPAQG